MVLSALAMPKNSSKLAHNTLSYKALTIRDAQHTITHVIASFRVKMGSLAPKRDMKNVSMCHAYAAIR